MRTRLKRKNPIALDTQINRVKRDKKEREYSKEEKEQIIYEYHNASLGEHQGATRTINTIKLTHNWHGLTKDVEDYIAKCEYCQKNKLSRKTKMPLVLKRQRNRSKNAP
ncbi:hypothetical protein P5V15_001120 [Pogonomyrmex californicus]